MNVTLGLYGGPASQRNESADVQVWVSLQRSLMYTVLRSEPTGRMSSVGEFTITSCTRGREIQIETEKERTDDDMDGINS